MFHRRRRNVQVGRGLGSILGTLARAVAPVAKSIFSKALPWLGITAKAIAKDAASKAAAVAKEAGKEVLKNATSVSDVKRGLTEVAKVAAQSAAEQAGKDIVAQVSDKIQSELSKRKGEGPAKKRKRDPKESESDSAKEGGKKRKVGPVFKRVNDIFE